MYSTCMIRMMMAHENSFGRYMCSSDLNVWSGAQRTAPYAHVKYGLGIIE